MIQIRPLVARSAADASAYPDHWYDVDIPFPAVYPIHCTLPDLNPANLVAKGLME